MSSDERHITGGKRKRYPRHVSRRSKLGSRGFACIALDHPTDNINVGHTLRASMCFGAKLVIIIGANKSLNVQHLTTDPGKTYRHIPIINTNNIFDALPEDCPLVAVEITENAIPLPRFVHPERACYIFGPENGSINSELLSLCKYRVEIPSIISLNLGMAVNVVLYDRITKIK